MSDLAYALVRLLELCVVGALIGLPIMSRFGDTIFGTKTGHDS